MAPRLLLFQDFVAQRQVRAECLAECLLENLLEAQEYISPFTSETVQDWFKKYSPNDSSALALDHFLYVLTLAAYQQLVPQFLARIESRAAKARATSSA